MIARETMAAFSDEFQQIKLAAAKVRQKSREGDDDEGPGPKSLGRTMASNALGLAAGTAAGYGAGKLIETVAKKKGVPMGAVWPKVMKGATTAMGMAYPIWKMTEQGTMSGRKRKK